MYEYKVNGMTCGSCARRVQNAIFSIDPNAEIQLDTNKQIVIVKTECSMREIGRVIQDAGYPILEEKNVA